jgi:hypothetical protein
MTPSRGCTTPSGVIIISLLASIWLSPAPRSSPKGRTHHWIGRGGLATGGSRATPVDQHPHEMSQNVSATLANHATHESSHTFCPAASHNTKLDDEHWRRHQAAPRTLWQGDNAIGPSQWQEVDSEDTHSGTMMRAQIACGAQIW